MMKTLAFCFLTFFLLSGAYGANSTLCNEFDNDPLARGYSGMTDQQVIDDLQTEYRQRDVDSMTGREFMSHVDISELFGGTVSDAERQMVITLSTASDIDPFGPIANVVIHIFGVGSTTINSLADARRVPVSRAGELGLGPIYVRDVAECR